MDRKSAREFIKSQVGESIDIFPRAFTLSEIVIMMEEFAKSDTASLEKQVKDLKVGLLAIKESLLFQGMQKPLVDKITELLTPMY